MCGLMPVQAASLDSDADATLCLLIDQHLLLFCLFRDVLLTQLLARQAVMAGGIDTGIAEAKKFV